MRPLTQLVSPHGLLLASLFAAGLPLVSACGDSPARAADVKEERSVPVVITRVTRGSMQRTVRAPGVLAAKRELDLSFKVPGLVQRVLVEEGAHVKRGQLLVVLDPTEVEAGSHQAAESYTKAARDLSRVRTLHDGKSVPRNALDDAETAVALARAGAQSAAFNLKHTALYAPEDGVIERRSVEVGEVVAPGRPVLHFKSNQGSVVKVGLIDRDLLRVQLGDRAEIVLDALPESPMAARVTRIATSRTPASGTFEVELALLDAHAAQQLPSGLTAKVAFTRDELALTVPLTALVDGDREQAAVFTLAAGRAQRHAVRVGEIEGERATLAAGLAENTEIVAVGAAELRDGARVRVVGEE